MYCVVYFLIKYLKSGIVKSIKIGNVVINGDESEEEIFCKIYKNLKLSDLEKYYNEGFFEEDFELVCKKCFSTDLKVNSSNKNIDCKFYKAGFYCFKDCIFRYENPTIQDLISELNKFLVIKIR